MYTLTFAGWGLFLLVGDVGLSSEGDIKDPSKSVEYIEVKRSLQTLELGRTGNTFVEVVCFPLMILADLALSFASLTSASRLTNSALLPGPGGVSRALAERDRGLSLVLGRGFQSAMSVYRAARHPVHMNIFRRSRVWKLQFDQSGQP